MNGLIRSKWSWLTVIIASALITVIIVPLCGWLYGCGCDWPWRGFYEHCNAFIAESPDKCPWCVNSFIDIITFRKSS
jgi:hypothetical protein